MKQDVLRDFLERLVAAIHQHQDGFSETVIRQIERQVRNDWVGERCYIGKLPGEQTRQAVEQEFRRGTPVRDIARRTGLGRSYVYELYKRRSGK